MGHTCPDGARTCYMAASGLIKCQYRHNKMASNVGENDDRLRISTSWRAHAAGGRESTRLSHGIHNGTGTRPFRLESGVSGVGKLVAAAVLAGFMFLAPGRVSAMQEGGNLTARGIGYIVESTVALDNPFDDAAHNPASSIAVLPDGSGVYVGGERGGLVFLSRNQENGSLTWANAWPTSSFVEALQSVEQILISPDGTKLVTLGAKGSNLGTFGLFSIGPNGTLDLLQEDNHRGIVRAAFSPTSSRDLYVIDNDRNALTHYEYTDDAGRFGGSQTLGGFSCMYGLGIAPNGLNVYVTDDCLHVVTNFKRDPGTGSLVFQDELEGNPLNGDGLGCIKSFSFSASSVWAVGLDSCDDVLSIISRDPDTGTLTPTSTVKPINPNGNNINMDKTWNLLVVSDRSGDIYFTRADWADQYILWVRADFGVGGDGSVLDTIWYPVDFMPSTLAISPKLDHIYVSNKENAVWRGGVLSREATPSAELGLLSGGSSGGNVVLAIALSLSLLGAVIVVGAVAKYIAQKRVIAKYSDEEETLRKMLQANPNDAVAHNNLGVLMETVHKDYKEAEFHYNEALRINPRAAFAHTSLGHLLHHRHRDFEAAEEHYRKAISLQWRSPNAHYNLGCLLQHQQNDLVEAERHYRHAIKCDPTHGMAQYNLGWVLEKVKNDLLGAEKCYRAALEADPKDKDARRRLAKVLGDQNEEEAHKLQEGKSSNSGKQEAKRAPKPPP
ncbi:unnamed protein product [Ascophyllum nodosum]